MNDEIYDEILSKHKELIDVALKKNDILYDDPLHFVGHSIDVVNYVRELLEVYDANAEVCIIAAYWHDVGRTVVDKGHEEESGRMLKDEMVRLGYGDEMIDACYSAVVNHKRNCVPPTIEGKIVRDADKIAYIGKNRWNRCMNEDASVLNEIIDIYLPILRDEILYLDYSKELFDRDMELYVNDYLRKMGKESHDDLLIALDVDKDPYIKELTNDRVINLTGQSGSGKSTYAEQYFNGNEYLIVDTDEIFSDKRFEVAVGINKALGDYFRSKYDVLPSLTGNFDLIYNEILYFCKDMDKIIVIDCAVFQSIKDVDNLKGKVIVLRTSINTCYERCIERFKNRFVDCTDEELERYKKKKSAMFEWYKYTNEFIKRIDEMEKK